MKELSSFRCTATIQYSVIPTHNAAIMRPSIDSKEEKQTIETKCQQRLGIQPWESN